MSFSRNCFSRFFFLFVCLFFFCPAVLLRWQPKFLKRWKPGFALINHALQVKLSSLSGPLIRLSSTKIDVSEDSLVKDNTPTPSAPSSEIMPLLNLSNFSYIQENYVDLKTSFACINITQ